MTLDFQSLQPELCLPILRKMSMKSLCRLRQACSSIDNFVELHRFRIEAGSYDTKTVLVISITADQNPQPQYHIVIGQMHISPFPIYRDKVDDFYKIEDPFSQLSAVRFDLVKVIKLRGDYWGYDLRIHAEKAQRKHSVFENEIVPIVRKMKIRCDWLEGNLEPFPVILPYVKFSRLRADDVMVTTAELLQWPTKHCNELDIKHLSDVPTSFFKVIGNASNVTIAFPLAPYGNHITLDDIVPNVLKELQSEPDRRNFQLLTLHGTTYLHEWLGYLPHDIDHPNTEKIWEGAPHNSRYIRPTIRFYKTSLSNGVAITVHNIAGFKFYICPKDDRETILDCLSSEMFQLFPYDCSFNFKKFMEAESDQAAFELLHSSYGN